MSHCELDATVPLSKPHGHDPSALTSSGEHSGDHNHQDFPKNIAIQMGGVLQYKWEAYCDTNGRSTDSIPFPQSVGAPKVLRYKWEAYCNTNGRCIVILFREVVVVGVSDILLILCSELSGFTCLRQCGL